MKSGEKLTRILTGDMASQPSYLRDGVWHDTKAVRVSLEFVQNEDRSSKFEIELKCSVEDPITAISMPNQKISNRTIHCLRNDETIMARWNIGLVKDSFKGPVNIVAISVLDYI